MGHFASQGGWPPPPPPPRIQGMIASVFKKVKNKAREIKAAADNLIGTVADMTNIIDLNEKKIDD